MPQTWVNTLEPAVDLTNTLATRVLVEERTEYCRKSISGMRGPVDVTSGIRYVLRTMVAISETVIPILDLLYWDGPACLVSCEYQSGPQIPGRERVTSVLPWRTRVDGQPVNASVDRSLNISDNLRRRNGEAQTWEWTLTLEGTFEGLLRAENLKPSIRLAGRGIEPPEDIVKNSLSEYRRNRGLLLSKLRG